MSLEQQLLALKKDLARATTLYDQAVGEKVAILNMLQDQGYPDAAAADLALEGLQKEAEKLNKEYAEKLKEIQEKYGE